MALANAAPPISFGAERAAAGRARD